MNIQLIFIKIFSILFVICMVILFPKFYSFSNELNKVAPKHFKEKNINIILDCLKAAFLCSFLFSTYITMIIIIILKIIF